MTESSFSKPQSHMPAITDILKSVLVSPPQVINYGLLIVVLIGDTNVGKTALVKRLVHDITPVKESCPTIGVEFAKLPIWDRIKNVAVQVHVWDTAGQEKFRSLTSQ